jgi:hypothetical protein
MPDLTTVTNFINSPPGQLIAGAALAGIVWKFFERVEAVLTDQTKFEIAVWLVGVNVGKTVEPWPDTFAKMFDRVFGTKHLSWRCFMRSCLTSYACFLLALIIMTAIRQESFAFQFLQIQFSRFLLFLAPLFVTVFPDYLSLLETRFLLRVMQRYRYFSLWTFILVLDIFLTGVTGVVALNLGPEFMLDTVPYAPRGHLRFEIEHLISDVYFSIRMAVAPIAPDRKYQAPFLCLWLPCFFTSIWLWLYAGSGFLLKFARRFDIGFEWFNRKFDIEKKPLSAIGLVSGTLVAMLYWAWATFRHFVLV